MATYTGTINFYNSWKEDLVEGANLESDAFKVLLTTSSYTPSASHTQISDITNECSGNGYARASLNVTTKSQSGGTYTFDADNVTFTASGGSITARYWVLFDDTLTNDKLVAYGYLDQTPGDVTVTDGNTLTVAWNASGIFTLA